MALGRVQQCCARATEHRPPRLKTDWFSASAAFLFLDTMEDSTFTASTESAAPAGSGVDTTATTTSASGAGAGEQAAAVPAIPDATAQETTGDQIDAGWQFGEEEAADAANPDDDSDIEGMLQEPGVDPEKVPSVVTALRTAREEVRNLRRELAQANAAQSATDLSPQQLEVVNKLFTATPDNGGVADVMNTLHQNAGPLYAQIVDDVIGADPDYALRKLQEMGAIPAQTQPLGPTVLDPEVIESLPANLQAVAKAMTPEDAAEFNELLTPEAQAGFLNRLDKLNRLDSAQRQQAQQHWQQQVQGAQQQGQQALQSLGEQYEKAHYAQLAKWSPFGPEDAAGNTQIYDAVVQGAFKELLGDAKFAQMREDAVNLISNAPMRRLRNEGMYADGDERQARQLAGQFNAKLGQLIKTRVEKLNSVFRDARAFREHQRQNAPNRTEIPGQSAQIGNGNGVKALDNKGRISDQYIDDLTSRLNLSGR